MYQRKSCRSSCILDLIDRGDVCNDGMDYTIEFQSSSRKAGL